MSCALAEAVEKGLQIDYDMMNRNWRVVKPSGATFTKSYDPNGNISTETDGENNTTAYTYNSKGWCTQTTDAAANNFDKTYDAMGRVATETVSPDGGQTLYTTSYTRDALGNPTAITDPLNNTHLNFYDTAGRLDYYIDRNGNTVGFYYNNIGKIQQINHPAPLDPSQSLQTTLTYNKFGKITSYDSTDIRKQYSYDALRRLVSEEAQMPSWPTAQSLLAEYGYDLKGRVTSINDYSSMQTTFQYDDVSRSRMISESNRTHTILYDPAGNVTGKQFSNGMSDSYTYDVDGRMCYQETRDSNSAVVGTKSFSFDDNGRVISDGASGCYGSYSTTYNFDNRGLITSENRNGGNWYQKSYSYDGMGCRTQKVDNNVTTNYTYNGLGRLITANNVTFSYDGNGNLTGKSTGEAFQYDYKNNLVRYQNSNDNTDMWYAYDIEKKRIAKGKSIQMSSRSSTIDAEKPGSHGKQVVTADKLTSGVRTVQNPCAFHELLLTWKEIYHVSDRFDLFLDISLDETMDGGTWDFTDYMVVSPDSPDPYIGQSSLDPNDYELLSIDLHLYMYSSGTPAASYDSNEIQSSGQLNDHCLCFTQQTSPSVHIGPNGYVESEGMLVADILGFLSTLDALWLSQNHQLKFIPDWEGIKGKFKANEEDPGEGGFFGDGGPAGFSKDELKKALQEKRPDIFTDALVDRIYNHFVHSTEWWNNIPLFRNTRYTMYMSAYVFLSILLLSNEEIDRIDIIELNTRIKEIAQCLSQVSRADALISDLHGAWKNRYLAHLDNKIANITKQIIDKYGQRVADIYKIWVKWHTARLRMKIAIDALKSIANKYKIPFNESDAEKDIDRYAKELKEQIKSKNPDGSKDDIDGIDRQVDRYKSDRKAADKNDAELNKVIKKEDREDVDRLFNERRELERRKNDAEQGTTVG